MTTQTLKGVNSSFKNLDKKS